MLARAGHVSAFRSPRTRSVRTRRGRRPDAPHVRRACCACASVSRPGCWFDLDFGRMWLMAVAGKSWFLPFVALVLVAAALGWSLSAQGAPRGAPAVSAPPAAAGAGNQAPSRAPVEFTEARSHRLGNTLRLPGTARSPRGADVASSAAGMVKAVHFREGQAITKGELLAILDVRSLEIRKETLGARLREATARSASAKNRFDRSSTLSKAQLISRTTRRCALRVSIAGLAGREPEIGDRRTGPLHLAR